MFRRITVEGGGDAVRASASFGPGVNFLEGREARLALSAMGVMLKDPILASCLKKCEIPEGSYITAELESEGKTFTVTARKENGMWVRRIMSEDGSETPVFHGPLRRSREEERLLCFFPDRDRDVADALAYYMDPDADRPDGDVLGRTGWIGTTRTFRKCLGDYVRNFPDEPFGSDGRRFVLGGDGRFGLETADGKKTSPVKAEDVDFNVRCFLGVDRFWRILGDIRDPNRTERPVYVIKTKPFRDENEEKRLVAALDMPGRQTFLADLSSCGADRSDAKPVYAGKYK